MDFVRYVHSHAGGCLDVDGHPPVYHAICGGASLADIQWLLSITLPQLDDKQKLSLLYAAVWYGRSDLDAVIPPADDTQAFVLAQVAAMRGHSELLSRFLPLCSPSQCSSLARISCAQGHISTLQNVLQCLDLDGLDIPRLSFTAAWHSRASLFIQILLPVISDFNSLFSLNLSLLYACMVSGCVDILNALSYRGVLCPTHFDVCEDLACVASRNGNVTALDWLVRCHPRGSQVLEEARDSDGFTPMFLAVTYDHTAVIDYIAACCPSGPSIVQVCKSNGVFPAYTAAYFGRVSALKALVQHALTGASILEQSLVSEHASASGVTPTWIACQNGHVAVLEYIVVPVVQPCWISLVMMAPLVHS